VLIDTAAPEAASFGPVTGDDVVSADEAARGVVVTGAGIAGATVQLTWDTVGTKSAVVDQTGAWSIRFEPFEVPSGSQSMTVVQYDSVGNPSSSTTRAITSTPPSIGSTAASSDMGAAPIMADPSHLHWHATSTSQAVL
jgi:hypothetical protein